MCQSTFSICRLIYFSQITLLVPNPSPFDSMQNCDSCLPSNGVCIILEGFMDFCEKLLVWELKKNFWSLTPWVKSVPVG